MSINNLEKKINIIFKNKNLLLKSLKHKSLDNVNNNEKLEFLGDRVLGLVISKKLLELYPDDKEGLLDKKLASLVNRKICLEVSKSFGLEKYIKTSPAASKKNKIEDKIISDTCEAIIGAIFLDQGIKAAEKFILDSWKEFINKTDDAKIDSKTRLQEYSLKLFKKLPIYKLITNSGPRHKPTFKIGVKIKNSKIVYGEGLSKKNAQQNAATELLKILNIV